MMWLTIIAALLIVSGVYTYARYTYHTEITGISVTIPGVGYCAYNGLTLSDCVLVEENSSDPYETVDEATTAIEAKGTPTFSSTATTDEGLYATEDDYGTSYYYRGAVEDNYVEYAGYIWRIVRVNGDGSVRLIYDGTEVHANGDSDTDRYYTTSAFNDNYYSNANVGYMYGDAYTENATTSTTQTLQDYYYYYSDSYDFDESTGYYTLTDATQQIWNSSLAGYYTCRSNTATTCTSMYYIYSYSSMYRGRYYTYTRTSSTDENGNTVYSESHGTSTTTGTFATRYYYGTGYTYDAAKGYTLTEYAYNVYDGTGISSQLTDYYTCGTTGYESCTTLYHIESYNSATVANVTKYTLTTNDYDTTHENKYNSTIKEVIDGFYTSKLDSSNTTDDAGNKYSAYLSDTLFCNDRSLQSGTGIGKVTTYYKGYNRLYTNKSPSLICTNKNDEFTVAEKELDDGTKVGNESLSYPIGLITADEVAMAGGVYNVSNSDYYLYIGNYFWTMTPFTFGSASEFVVNTNQSVHSVVVNNAFVGARPVVNLSSDVYVYSGTGTQDDPYQVSLTKREIPSGCNGELSCEMLLNSTGESTVSAAKTAIEDKGDPDFSSAATTDEGLYAASDDYGTSYYYRGAVTDNYVSYAGYIWRIIRVNGDGSVRMIYDGTSAYANGTSSTDRYYTTSAFNSIYTDNANIGYMYGTSSASTYDDTHTNTNSSTIKTVLDTFYEEKLDSSTKTDDDGNKYSAYLSDTLFCNDRSVYSGTGIGTTTTYYYGYNRLVTNKSPVLTCTNKNDRFTVSDRVNGNGDLTYPIGLITADEVAMAGGVVWSSNKNYYLYNGDAWWTMTPFYTNSNAYVLQVNGDYFIVDFDVHDSNGARPVVNLSSEVLVSGGDGTKDSPYTLKLAS